MINPMENKIFYISSFIFFLLFNNFLIHKVMTLDLSIDNHLFIPSSDCYTRISIGSRLANRSVISTNKIATVLDCKAACSANGTSCSAFSFGIGVRGNSTCMLGRFVQQRQDNLQQDPDYDVYVKGHVSLAGCSSQNITNLHSTDVSLMKSNQSHHNTKLNHTIGINFSINNSNNNKLFGNTNFLNTLKNSFFDKLNNKNDVININHSITLSKSMDDDKKQIFNILLNKYNEKNVNENELNGLYEYKSTILPLLNNDFYENTYHDNNVKNYLNFHKEKNRDNDNFDELYSEIINPLNNINELPITTMDFNTQFDDDYYLNYNKNRELNNKNRDENQWWLDLSISKQTATNTDGWSENEYLNGYNACFRRMFTGKRIADGYVRRAIECHTLHDCYRMCEYERGFTCEGFNYRLSSVGKNICELISTPLNRVDINRDFTVDRHCEFYERDRSQQKCYRNGDKPPRPSSVYSPPQSSNNWWSADPRPINWNTPNRNPENYSPTRNPIPSDPPSSPSSSTHAAAPYGGSFNGDTQLSLELPRPIDSNQRYPNSRPSYNPDDSYLSSGLNGNHQPIPVRPLDDDYRHHHHRQPPAIRPGIRDDIYYHDRIPDRVYKRPNYIPSPSGGDFDGYNGNGYSYGRPVSSGWQNWRPTHGGKYPNKRIGYGPEPETNEIGPTYIPSHRRPSLPPSPPLKHDWDNYGYSYADGYHTNYIGSNPKFPSLHPPGIYPPRLPPPPTPSSSSSHSVSDQHHHNGQFYNYGGGYGYSNRPAVPPKIYPTPGSNRCSVKSTSGFKLTRGIIHKSYLTTNLDQCEKLCERQKDFVCRTFAFRYNLASTSPFDNCLLSDAAFENLVFYTDLEPDRDYDIYAMTDNSKWCETYVNIPNMRRPRPPDECFWRVRSGFCMPPSIIKKPIRVDGMGECQVQCVGSRDFTCRSFVFRYEAHPGDGMPNCFLSDWPAMEVEPKDMQTMNGAELYERGSYGRGCEPTHPNTLSLPPYKLSPPVGETHDRLPSTPPLDDASCYADYDRPCKLTPYAIIFSTRVASKIDCQHKCSTVRHRNIMPCMSFNFRIADDHSNDNCFLSDISMRDLQHGLDYTHDENYVLYVWRETEPKCSLINNHFDDRHANFHPLNRPFNSGHTLIDGKPYAKPENPYYYEINVPEPNKPRPTSLNLDFHGNGNNGYDDRFLNPNVPDEFSIFRRFTVNGQACKLGTRCERNLVVGFWSCEPEGAEPGAWDYCCEPTHHCGYSQGYNYQWCYVGLSFDQWRPCNDKYYPYQLNPRPNIPTINRPSYPRVDNDINYQSRHWPITFLHDEAPPNTTDSVALANDVTDESITNKSIVTTMKNNFNVSSESVSNHTTKRGINEVFMALNKKRKDHLTVVPLKLNGSDLINRTNEKSEGQRLNSRFKKPTANENVTVKYSPRFLRDGHSGQYHITKKLNVRFPMRSINKINQSRSNAAKIERVVVKDNNFNNGSSKILKNNSVTTTSSMELQYSTTNNITINNTTPISTETLNKTVISSPTKYNLKKMKIIGKSNV